MNKNLSRIIIWLVIMYAVLFTGRLIYVTEVPEPDKQKQNFRNFEPSFSGTETVRNYAKVMFQAPGGNFQIGQTYEKIAEVYNSTNDFTEDEKKLSEIIKSEDALIQKQHLSGQPGRRYIGMSIGVYPDKFDETVEKLKVVGMNERFQVTKTDKTSEYKKLRAEKAALEERKRSLTMLKSRNGKVEELIELENKIYDVVKEIRGVDLSIGEFEGVKDFCTISFSLTEIGQKPSRGSKIGAAFDWALWKMLVIVVLVTIAAIGVFFVTKIVLVLKDRLKPADVQSAQENNAGKYDIVTEQTEVKSTSRRKQK